MEYHWLWLTTFQDLSAIIAALSEHTSAATVSDGRIALVCYRDELVIRLQTLRDARMGRSIARAVNDDTLVLQEEREQENSAIKDRAVALHIAEEDGHSVQDVGAGPAPVQSLTAPVIDLTGLANERLMRRLTMMNSVVTPIIELVSKPPFRLGQHLRQLRAFDNKENVNGVKKTCVACHEPVEYFAAVYAPCGHDYCKACITQLFSMATIEESLFPPRCCGEPIPMVCADVFFTQDFITAFEAKKYEWSIPNRTYCAQPSCGAFIPPSAIELDFGVCPSCALQTCTICKGPAHEGEDCLEDPSTKSLIETAEAARWQQCYQCNRYIELILGCNHMEYVKSSVPRRVLLIVK